MAVAQVAIWTNGGGAGTGDFYDGANWDTGTAPGAGGIAIIDGGGTATIDSTGTGAAADIESINAGGALASGTSGNVVMDSGFLRVNANTTFAGASGSTGSFIMNGGEIHFGDIAGTSGDQTGIGGLPSLDVVFAANADTNGTFEMHNNAIYRGMDDVTLGNHNLSGPVGSAATSVSTLIMDGNSQFSTADGFNTRGLLAMTLSDNAEMTLGNSMGAANPAGAYQRNSGYINIGSRRGSQATIVVENNAVFNASRIQNNDGTSTITVRDNGEFNIFNTSTGGTEVDFQGQSYLGRGSSTSDGPSSTIITLEGNGKFTVDSNPLTVNPDGTDGSPDLLAQAGLTLSGGDDEPVELPASGNGNGPGGNNGNGGYTLVDVKDSAEFSIVQSLWMTYGKLSSASSTLKVTGPDANVSIGDDLVMAKVINQQLDRNSGVVTIAPELLNRDGTAALHSVITGSTHSTILVGDEALIDNGHLIVELDGYDPLLGDSYTLLTTGNLAGVSGEFLTVDDSLAVLSPGLSWSLDYNPSSVVLSVIPEPSSLLLMSVAVAAISGTRRRKV